MIDYISDLFDNILIGEGYAKTISSITYVVKNIIYVKKNLKLIITCELMEYNFDFEIFFSSQGTWYSVCEQKGRLQKHYEK